MKVVHYATALSRSGGGVFQALAGLARAQKAAGAEVVVLGGADGHFEQDRRCWGDVDVRPRPLRSGYGFDPRIVADLHALGPDIVHIHGIWSAASVYGRVAAGRRVPLVVSPHGMLEPFILARRPGIKRVHAALFERPMLSRAHVHALNGQELSSAIAFAPGLANRSFVIPNGIDTLDGSVDPASRSGVLYLGRLHEKKQVLELVQKWAAAPALRDHTLTVAGWGEAGYQARIAAAARAAANVEWVGALYGAAKMEALRRARFFILPSLSEGLPMAVLEALGAGSVPVLTDGCNMPELFQDGIAVRIATDFSDFVPRLTQALALDARHFAALSARARAHAARYCWPGIAARMLERYHAIMEMSCEG